MSRAQAPAHSSSQWSNGQYNTVSTNPSQTISGGYDAHHVDQQNGHHYPSSSNIQFGADRPPPTRSSTLGSDRIQPPARDTVPQARSEDLTHSNSYHAPEQLARPSPSFYNPHSSSRPNSPPGSRKVYGSEDAQKRMSVTSISSNASASSVSGRHPQSSSSSSNAGLSSATCAACGKAMQGPFVRALGTVFHLNCFKCMDCGDVVASKFFPIEGQDGKQQPLCERDYFRRLNLICAKCGMALRGSYITACQKKFHVEHFTCSLCSTLFGPQDSYYEHEGDVYCHFHYSTRFATKCAGCNSAILKQFVEINRNSRDECWHPECYMINKFWNVKVVSRRPSSAIDSEAVDAAVLLYEQEAMASPTGLKDQQARMEQQVYRIWTVLSAFEESSAACISDMLRQVSNGQYLDAIRMAEKFILHVEVLFATIDDLEYHFSRLNIKGMSHVREARMLCRKTVELFTLLSHTQETGSRRMGMTQELLALVTGLAHYLKILIRIALTGALKLEREQSVHEAMTSFLDKLHLLAVQGGNPSARRVIKGPGAEQGGSTSGNHGTSGVTYGFRSLAPENAGDSPFHAGASKLSSTHPPSDLCVKCKLTVEEDCVRLGTYQRWHSQCVQCAQCGVVAAVPVAKEPTPTNGEEAPKVSSARKPPARVGHFVYDITSMKDTPSFGEIPTVILCTDHANASCRAGFRAVQRLEQYAFLLNVALRRLYLLLKKQGVVPLSPGASQAPTEGDPYRDSADIMRMKSVHLDRKLSATAHLPKRSTIVESPAGRIAHTSDSLQPQRSQEQMSQPYSQQSHARSPPNPHQPSPPLRPQQGMLDPQSRPALPRTNTEVMIVDESGPNSPDAIGAPDLPPMEDGNISLADIPQLMEVAQAREQHRSLPRNNSIPFIAELTPLELAIVKHSAILALTRSPLREHIDVDELLEMVEMKKTGFWNKWFKGDKKNVKKKGVFGVPLELLLEREGCDCQLGASRATLRVPSFVDDVVSAMRQMDMSVEGIFRKNGNIKRLRDLTEAIDRDPSTVDLTQDHPVQLAALLKKFLRELPDPLMTFKLHKLLVASQALPEPEARRTLHMLAIIMPKSHRDTMEVLFVFLKWVASFAHLDEETGSKMDLGNLATVICPSILISKGRDAVRDDSFGAIRVITALLENQDEFFTVPNDFLAILQDQEYFANTMELPGKEFLKKCDTYFKLKSGHPGARTPGTPYNGPQSNGSTPRFAGPAVSSPALERPGMGSAGPSDRAMRPHPGMPPQNNSFAPSSPMPLNMTPRQDGWQQQQQYQQHLQQQQHQLQHPQAQQPQQSQQSHQPRPLSRPSSVVQSRASTDQSGYGFTPTYPNANGQPLHTS